MQIRFSEPYLTGDEVSAMGEAILSGKHCGNGPFTQRCVELIQSGFGVKHAYLVPSGTAALEMTTILSDIRPGDEVIMPSYTFSSTANAFVLRGAKPVFADVDPETLVLDLRDAERRITPRTKAIVPINYGGVSVDLDALSELCAQTRTTLIEDAAQGVDAKYRGRYVGSIAPISIYSFHETKNVTCGEGGALLLNDSTLIDKAEFAQEKGTDRSKMIAGLKSKYTWVSVGSSYLLAEPLAAMLLTQLRARDVIKTKRRVVYEFYQALFKPLERAGRLRTQRVPTYCEINYHGYYLILNSESERDRFLQFMRERGISCYFHYQALHKSEMGAALGQSNKTLPVTELLEKTIARLPMHCGILPEQLAYFGEQATRFFR